MTLRSRSQSAVLPSMSVKRKVTVPEGRSAIDRSIGLRREFLSELLPIVALRWEVWLIESRLRFVPGPTIRPFAAPRSLPALVRAAGRVPRPRRMLPEIGRAHD